MVELLSLLAIPVILKATHAVYLAYKFFFRAGKDLKKYGEWAVVTGATDGIGKAYAFELAAQGLKVLLVARSEEKLADTAKELKSARSGATVDVLQVDFSKFDASARAMVKSKLAPLDIGILINNVGMSYPFTKYFHELKDSEVADIMQVNMDSMTWMTRIVLGEIDEDLKPKSGMLLRKRGAIINTSSGGARTTSPLLAEYSAAKAYVEKFSQGLAAELAPKGIDVQAQTPLFVTTKMAKIRKASMTVPTPEDYVKCAARQIGYDPVISPWKSEGWPGVYTERAVKACCGTEKIALLHLLVDSQTRDDLDRRDDQLQPVPLTGPKLPARGTHVWTGSPRRSQLYSNSVALLGLAYMSPPTCMSYANIAPFVAQTVRWLEVVHSGNIPLHLRLPAVLTPLREILMPSSMAKQIGGGRDEPAPGSVTEHPGARPGPPSVANTAATPWWTQDRHHRLGGIREERPPRGRGGPPPPVNRRPKVIDDDDSLRIMAQTWGYDDYAMGTPRGTTDFESLYTWAHSLQLWVLSWLPESVAIYLVDWQHQDIRKRGIKKEKEKSEQAKKGQ
ncbi:Very-long-chain 3-oxoacyl-CoA reductase 1 [Symbiodinium microadriaticum]|uniref:Very-long-chain 3-oxoacyl-CoA reductase 1 n=1 Tax=Symbiodinium microadriaticum TaxID=2951 RepID=A0A1Q9ED56_SYMMI|nr:Very-long-chain 3-oxoacyl-CoA reductase 1 [Symbiodinium microadriaticum]